MKQIDNLVVNGRRWFDKRWGNTYHSCDVLVDSELVGRTDYEYGYGDCYRQTAFNLLQQAGYFEDGSYSDFVDWCREDYKRAMFFVSDVGRKKDL